MSDDRTPVDAPASAFPALLLVAHGTASPIGLATTEALVDALRAARAGISVTHCYLDVASPALPETLATTPGPTVLVPLLLSTGYHVQTDIPAAVGEREDVRIARHLGPHPLLVDAMCERLGPSRPGVATVLVGAGSSRPEAADELRTIAELVAERRGGRVEWLTMTDDLTRLDGVDVATYLLAEGYFLSKLRRSVPASVRVADPIGVHPALVELVWLRYDEALADPAEARAEVR